MKHLNTKMFFASVLSLMLVLNVSAQKKEISKTFDAKEKLEITTALGGIILKQSPDSKIHLYITHNYDQGEFDLKVKEKSNKLELEEDLNVNDSDGKSSQWTVSIPQNCEVEFNSGTGSITANGLKGTVEGSSGTGGVEVNNCEGEFELSSGTGSVNVNNCSGEFEVSSGTGSVRVKSFSGELEANSGTGKVVLEDSEGTFDANSGTGDCEAKNITIDVESEFNSGTGDAEVIAPKGSNFSLTIASGTGDALLDMSGVPLEGYFEMTAHQRKGRIVSPEKFDNEEIIENGNDEKYDKKSFTKGSGSNKFYIKTGTGTAKLKK